MNPLFILSVTSAGKEGVIPQITIVPGMIMLALIVLVIGFVLGFCICWVIQLHLQLKIKEEKLEDMKKLGELEYKVSLLEATGKGKKSAD